jgi:branched-chain amino acid transport system substrate-binding protein
MYLDAFNVCLDHATNGTGAVNGRPIAVATADDAGDPAKATTAATDYIGQGYQILAGSASSGVALQVAPLAQENQVLFISGPAATDAITGVNKYTFRSGRQTYQDIATAASFVGDLQGKKATIFAQDSAFGQANVAAASAVFGAEGATVTPLLVPATATDLVPFAKQAADADPDLLFVAWAGTNARCGRRWASRARSTAPPWSPVWTSSPPTPFSLRSRTSSRCWPTTSTAPPTTRWSRRWSPG